MDRTLIAWNLPNMITIPLMAAIGFLIAGAAWQVVRSRMGGGTVSTAGGY